MSQDVHSLAGAYALDALDDVERQLFERHLASCGACSAEVDEFLLTTSRLGSAVAVAPPPAMRNRVLAAVDTTRQRPPLPARAVPAAQRLRRLAAPLAAAAVAAVLTFVAASVLDADRDPGPRPSDVLAEILAEPDARTVALDSTGEFVGTVVTAPTAQRALLTLSGLQERPGEVYVVWTEREGELVRAGELAAEADGEAATLVLEAADNVASVAVTREPPGDGTAPAGPIVAQAALE